MVVTKGRRNWIYRYIGEHGRERRMGLGSANDVSLAEARGAAEEARRLRRQGIDPIDYRRNEKQAAQLKAAAKRISLTAAAPMCGNACFASEPRHCLGCRGCRHPAACAVMYASAASANVDANAVLRVLQPIWHTKTETA
jgi:hypothetical protein